MSGDLTPRMSVVSHKLGTPRSTFRDSKPARSRRGGGSRARPRTAASRATKQAAARRRPVSARGRGGDMLAGGLTARSKNTGLFPGGSARLSSSLAKPTQVRRDRQDFSGGRSGPLRVDLDGRFHPDVMREYSEHEALAAFERMREHHRRNGW